MKLYSALITLLLAIVISAVAAYFSVIGLAALFAATAIPVIIMGTTLEAGKLVAAQWLKSNWTNPKVNLLHKIYLLAAIVALMLITSLGIYGFLSKGHLEQEAPVAGITLQIEQKNQQLKVLEAQNQRLYDKLNQLDAGVNTYLKGENADKALRARNTQRRERNSIDKQIAENNTKIQALNDEILPLKMQSSEVEAKLGPVKYVAELFGWEDPGTAVRFVIMILMFAFDPLAIVLLLSATITFDDYFEERKKAKEGSSSPPQTTDEPKVNKPEIVFTTASDTTAVDPVDVEIHDEIAAPDQKEVEFLGEVIASGNVTPEVEQEVAPVVATATKKVRKPRKPRKQKEQSISINQEVPETDPDDQYRRTLKTFVTTAYQGGDIELQPTDEQKFIEILENRPELLEEMIDVISEANDSNQKKVQVPESEKLQDSDVKQQKVLSTDVSQEQIQKNLSGGSWLGGPTK